MQRRTFARAVAVTALSYSRIKGANRRVSLGLIGCGGRGRYVGGFMKEAPDAEFVALADVYMPNTERLKSWAAPGAKTHQDFRKLLEDKSVEAVLVATPDHWHAGATILACQAGKHVYVEKPLTHNIKEGRAMIDAAKRNNRIVETGTQQRSAPHFKEVQKILASGELGPIHFVRVWNFSNMLPDGIGKAPDSEPPAGMDWDMYCGPAPKVPFNPKRHQSTFRWFWDYAGGTITDYGTHRFDTVHQIMGVDAPKTVSATGGRFALKDAGEMPDILQVTYEYPTFVMSYEACNISAHGLGGRTAGLKYYNARGPEDRPNGMAFYGTNGALFTDRVGWEVYPDLKPRSSSEFRAERRFKQAADATRIHAMNFVEVVRENAKQAAPVEVGHRSTIIAHLGNIAYKTGRKLRWDAAKEEFTGDSEANRLLSRNARKPWQIPT